MKKIITFTLISAVLLYGVFAQSADDDFFFDDDGIDEFVAPTDARTDEVNHGSLFETGSIKIGGTFNTSISTMTTLWADDSKDFGKNLKDTSLTPTASAFLTVDARPTQTLRMYTKFGLAYPFETTAASTAQSIVYDNPLYVFNPKEAQKYYAFTGVSTSVSDYLKVKELFTDFSVADRAFFRFGLHTVTWGTGYFFSPVSDMINKSSINPEDTDAQVDGALNLRTQITFPGTQNCLWIYVIPVDITTGTTAQTYLRDTALAAKGDVVFGNWELGFGGYYKYENAPKAMVTATGSLKKMSIFGEAVYQYGGNSEWAKNKEWKDKTNIIQATAGVSYFWKNPSITLATQYYFDGNDVDAMRVMKASSLPAVSVLGKLNSEDTLFSIPRLYQGHNIALMANFGRIFGTTDVTATVFGMANFGREDTYIAEGALDVIKLMGQNISENDLKLTSVIFSAMLNYTPVNDVKLSVGPYMTMNAFDEPPVISFKFTATLGGGKF